MVYGLRLRPNCSPPVDPENKTPLPASEIHAVTSPIDDISPQPWTMFPVRTLLGYTFHLNQDTLVNALGAVAGVGYGPLSIVNIWNSNGVVVASAYISRDDSSGTTTVGGYDFTGIPEIRLAAGDYTIAGSSYLPFTVGQVVSGADVPGGYASYVSPLIGVTDTLVSFANAPYNRPDLFEASLSSFLHLGAMYPNNGLMSSLPVTFSGIAAPVPEPETYAMFLLGLGVIGAIRIRRRKW